MQRKNAKTSVQDFFDANAAKFIKFGKTFIANLTDEALINELAQKDLESWRRCSSWFLKFSAKIPATTLRKRLPSLSQPILLSRRRTRNDLFAKTGTGASVA